MKSKSSPFIAIAVVMGLLLGGLILLPRLMNTDAYQGNNCLRYKQAISATDSFLAQTPDGQKREELKRHRADYLQQALDANCKNELEGAGIPVPSDSPSATPSASATPSSPSTSAAPQHSANPDSWTPHYYTKDAGKLSAWAFGPSVMPNTAEEATRQWWDDHTADPSLLCENGGLIIHGSGDARTSDCTKQLAASKKARDALLQEVRDMIAKQEWVTLPAHTANTGYMVVVDGIPITNTAYNVKRLTAEKFYKVTTKDGRVYFFRPLCRWQWNEVTGYTVISEKPVIVPCVNGGERDGESRCVPPVDVCRQVSTSEWQVLRGILPSQKKPGDLPADSEKCREAPSPPPTTTTPTPTSTFTGTPTPTGTSTPTGSPTGTPTPTPSTTPKDPSKDPSENGNSDNGGGQNSGLGETTNPTPAPETPRESPAPPAATTAPAPTISSNPNPSPSTAVTPSSGDNSGVIVVH